MTQEQLEGDRLIAEFKCTKSFDTYFDSEGQYHFEISDAKYHSSLDWLMPVAEKICSIVIKGHYPFNGDQLVRVEIVPNGYVRISNLRDTPILKNVSVEGSLIKAVWLAVIEFLKWYNQNK